jgi:hypothetical protein
VEPQGLTEKMVRDPQDIMRLMEEGSAQRATGSTGANEWSSRSHAVMQVSFSIAVLVCACAGLPPQMLFALSPAAYPDGAWCHQSARQDFLHRSRRIRERRRHVRATTLPSLYFCNIWSRTLPQIPTPSLSVIVMSTFSYHNDKKTRLEGAEINKSLLALKE